MEAILPNIRVELIRPEISAAGAESFETIGWNINHIGAPAVWENYGLDGAGVVVGVIDTGVEWTHEALISKWRGYTAAGPDPTFNWFDAVSGAPLPYDDVGHGTHVTGTILGSDPGGANRIGVAPGARWIAVKAFDESGGTAARLLAAGQYLLAPTDRAGVPHPEMAPDIINNSWGGGPGFNEWYRPMVQAWRDAGILPVFAAGNAGPDAATINNPANYPESLAAAAVDRYNRLASFSSRGPGPGQYGEIWKPDLSAPGVNIRSATPGGGYQGGWRGTSMAAPHIAGTAALLLSANASLGVGDLEAILRATARPLTDDHYTVSPNHGYGYGLVDALGAVAAAIENAYGTLSGRVLAAGEDQADPVIQHTAVTEALYHTDLKIMARISDDVALHEAQVWFSPLAEENWRYAPMDLVSGDQRSGIYRAIVPYFFVGQEDFRYHLRAADWCGNAAQTPTYQVAVKEGYVGEVPGKYWDFESYPSGWDWSGGWAWGVPTGGPAPISGTRLMATNLRGNYADGVTSALVTPPLDLRDTGLTSASLRLRHWYDSEEGNDVATVAVFDPADIAGTWRNIYFFTGNDRQWRPLYIDLTGYIGHPNPLYVIFLFFANDSINYNGWYIDDVYLCGNDHEAPANPTGLTAAAAGAGVALSWTAPPDPDVKGYRVYRSPTSGGPYSRIGSSATANYLDADFAGGTEYFYVVTACDYSGNESGFSNQASAVSPWVEAPYSWDFEDNDGGFVPYVGSDIAFNDWQWGVPSSGPGSAYAGQKVWATNLAGDYRNNSVSWLDAPRIDLGGYSGAVLEFAHWHDLENHYDWGAVLVYPEGADSWEVLEVYTGESAGWVVERITLDSYAGRNIWLSWLLVSDGSITRDGWHIDQARIIAAPAGGGGGASPGSISGAERPAGSREGVAGSAAGCKSKPELPELTGLLEMIAGRGLLPQVQRDPADYTIFHGSEYQAQGFPGRIPLEATLTVLESNRGARTASNGEFLLHHQPIASGTLRVEAYGYTTIELPFTLAAGQLLPLGDLVLAEAPRGALTGTVTGELTGAAVAGAAITVLGAGRELLTYTGGNGGFLLNGVLAGSYSVRVTAGGYHTANIPVTVAGGQTTALKINLVPFAGQNVAELAYDNGTVDAALSFLREGNGVGVRMTPARAALLQGASIYFWRPGVPFPGGNYAAVAVFDSLPNGQPGEAVIRPFITEITRGQWNYIDLSKYNFSTSRDFYVAAIQVGNHPNTPALGFDSSYPGSGRTYRYDEGQWGSEPWDYVGGNALIRARVSYGAPVPVSGVSLDRTGLTIERQASGMLTATVRPANASNKALLWSSDNPAVATVTAVDGRRARVDAHAMGAANITVTTADGSRTAVCRVTVPAAVVSLEVTPGTALLEAGRTLSLRAAALYEDGRRVTVTSQAQWESSNAGVATVSRGSVRAISRGSATVTVTYGRVSKQIPITVIPALNRLAADPAGLSLEVGQSFAPVITALYRGEAPEIVTTLCAWSSRQPQIATVDADGQITAVAPGRATIIAAYASKRVTIQVNVIPVVADLLVVPDSVFLEAGRTAGLRVTARHEGGYRDAVVTTQSGWSSANGAIATVSRGRVRAISRGSTTVTVTYGRVSKQIPVTVIPALNRLTADPAGLSLKVGHSFTPVITALYRGEAPEIVTTLCAWSSRQPQIATVDADGQITAVAPGRATIIAAYASKRVTITVNVVSP